MKIIKEIGESIMLEKKNGAEVTNDASKFDSYLEDLYEVKKNPPTVKVRYHRELFPQLMDIQWNRYGDFVDLRAAEDVSLKAGEFATISLGISIELPEGYWAQFVPRSSTFKNYGIVQTNSFAVIDNTYSGDSDIWKMPVYATRDTVIKANERICQFRIVKKQEFQMKTVPLLEGPERGGFGTSGKI